MMITCSRMVFSLALFSLLVAGRADATAPIATVRGLVTDEAGRPLEGVTVQMFLIEEFRDGTWRRDARTGMMPRYSTDKRGRFALPFHRRDIRCSFWFDKPGFAPTFLSGVSAESEELKIVMARGMTVAGFVTRLGKGRQEPVIGTMVELRLVTSDLAYQQRAITDPDGRYTLRISPPPGEATWWVVFAGEAVQVHVQKGKPVPGVDFEVQVTVVQPDTPADADKPRR